jgi:hypothetical protein
MNKNLITIKNLVKAFFGFRFKNGYTVREVFAELKQKHQKELGSTLEEPYFVPATSKAYIKIGYLSSWEVDMEYQKPIRITTDTTPMPTNSSLLVIK